MTGDEYRRKTLLALARETPPRPHDLPNLRAAYSDRSAALMAYLAAFAYHPSVAIRQAQPVPTELARLGFDSFATFTNKLTDGYAFVAESDALSVLSFRGTDSNANWHTDFQAKLIHPAHTAAKLRVHQGFYKAFEDLAKDGLRETIETRVAAAQDRPLYITGHSLGGALAQIAAAVFACDTIAACYTYGAPRVGNAYFDLWVKPPSYRVINHADLVPQLPLWLPFSPYRPSGDPRYLPARVTGSPYRYQPNGWLRLWQLGQGVISLVRRGSCLGVDEHAISAYCKKLDKIAAARRQGR